MNTILKSWEQDGKCSIEKAPSVIIIGAGKFGKKATERLYKRYPTARFIIVDIRNDAFSFNISQYVNIETVVYDGVKYLIENQINPYSWIVPAIPLHLAFLWLHDIMMARRIELRPYPLPESLIKCLPNVFIYKDNCVFTSYATFVCPDTCSEPQDICTYTKKPRNPNLFDLIAASIPEGFFGLVFRSYQLAPGVGGYPAHHLYRARKWLESIHTGCRLIVATACRCHGIVHGAQIESV